MNGLRLMTAADIPRAMLLKQAAGWNQTEHDWLRVLDLEPDGCFCIEHDGRVIATATAISYDRNLAWIGMVLTHPEYRGQGMASQLMRRALEFLDGRQEQWIKLDATAMGSPLYRKLGFVDECPVERWLREPRELQAPVPIPLRTVQSYQPDAAMDLRAFGADRSRLLSRLATVESASIPGSGYAMGRLGANASYFGPCVSLNAETAESLLLWFLDGHSTEPVMWDLLPDNREAVQLAQRFGFARVRQLVRMARPATGAPEELSTNVQQTYAIAGFEFG
jgi:GNAT superfamily N-acetyltransferase